MLTVVINDAKTQRTVRLCQRQLALKMRYPPQLFEFLRLHAVG